jgi:multidrug efflux pump
MFCFLKMPNPNIPFWTNGWTTTLNIYSQVGLVTLVGLISKNGILIVQFANELQRQGRTKIQAIREAAMLRLRPVLMTSVATVAGNFRSSSSPAPARRRATPSASCSWPA